MAAADCRPDPTTGRTGAAHVPPAPEVSTNALQTPLPHLPYYETIDIYTYDTTHTRAQTHVSRKKKRDKYMCVCTHTYVYHDYTHLWRCLDYDETRMNERKIYIILRGMEICVCFDDDDDDDDIMTMICTAWCTRLLSLCRILLPPPPSPLPLPPTTTSRKTKL